MITHFQPFVEGLHLPLLWADVLQFLHDPCYMPCTVWFHHSRRGEMVLLMSRWTCRWTSVGFVGTVHLCEVWSIQSWGPIRNMPLLHTSTQSPGAPQHVISFTRPFPMLVLQATNAGVRRPGYKAWQTTHTTITMYCKGRHVHKMVHFGIIWLLTCIYLWHSRVQILLYLELHTPNMEYSYLVGYVHIGSMLDQLSHNPHIPFPSCHHEGCLLILYKSSTTNCKDNVLQLLWAGAS